MYYASHLFHFCTLHSKYTQEYNYDFRDAVQEFLLEQGRNHVNFFCGKSSIRAKDKANRFVDLLDTIFV
ncbi:MAG: hypothetical protein A2161_19210 [Candidatus Schekmanbacteria bacterium RBG_13_48_7]|uniref:Uncharacterized protein n=1 Tax=Candidatus Schekmanbacteria bacterium RBG_13_48_7 TaxID=1817878 RepID=A0A1F7S7P4_9BACT|nr:MAG: hypothetical protein A2161_19210 [Candidatus Schekmanbacteria bacterium RBG_13_48_7]